MKYLSVCSGIEAASKAWEPIGWEPVAFSEIEPFPSAVLKHHWPEVPNLGDMSKYEQWQIQSGSVDILVGGTPCQSFSVAGLRQGLKDPRGNLMLTYLAIAERLKPRWLVWENVPGVLSSNGGKDFGSFLGALGELGYEWAYRVLDAQWFGVAQRRRRVFVVAHFGEGNLAAKVLFESESVRRDSAPSRETRQGVATNVAPSLTASNDPSRSPQSSEVTQQVNAVLEASVVSPTITQCKGSRGGCSDEALMEIKAVHEAINAGIPDVCATIDCGLAKQVGKQLTQQAESFYFPIPIHDQATRFSGKRGDKQDGKGNGLGVGKPGDPCPTLTKGDKHAIAFQTSELRLTGKLTEKSVCPTLKANTKAGDTEVKVVLYENHPNDSRVTGPHDVAPSCVSRYGTGGGNVPLVQEAIAFPATMSGTQCAKTKNLSPAICSVNQTAIAFEPGIATREGSESRFVKELSPTLRKEMGDNQVAVAVDCYNKTIGEKSQSISSSASDINHTGGVINPADRMAVRRLSPRECERLQGFNDDHTMIPWRNKPADQCPDGPRYKALGNSMAVPCMAWIGKRIDAVEKTK
jgi:DNA-cytosine methyltransferase